MPRQSDIDFKRALPFILKYEGGKVDNKNDAGGRTAFGITHKTYDGFRLASGLPARDVFLITPEEVATIYHLQYWNAVTAGRTWPLNLVLFDVAVNMGVSRALQFLAVAKVIPVLASQDRMSVLATRVLNLRRHWYNARVIIRPDQSVFLRGWLNRVASLQRTIDAPLA